VGASYSLLLVSSDEVLAATVQGHAEALPEDGGHGLTVDVATRLAEGLDRALGGGYDALLLVLGTPDAARAASFRSTFAAASGLPVMVLATDTEADAALEWLDWGADDVLTPDTLSPVSLYRSVASAVRRRELEVDRDQWRASSEVVEERFRSIFDIAGDGILLVDRHGVIKYLNPAAEKLFDRRREELEGLSLGLPQVSGSTTDIEIITRSGAARVVEMRVVDTRWDGQEAILATLREVTERVQAHATVVDAKAEVEASAQRMDEILSTVPHAVLLLDDGHVALYANATSERILGMGPDALMGRPLPEIGIPLLDRLSHLADRATSSAVIAEDRLERTTDAGTRLLAALATPLERTFGRGRGVLLSVRDITDSTETQVRYQALFDEANLGVAVTSVSGEVREANRRMAHLLEVGDEPASADLLIRCVHADDRDLLLDLVRSAGRRTPVLRFVPQGGGDQVWGQVAVSSILEGGGEGRIVVVHDVTEQKRLEEQLLQAQKIEALGQLAGGVAHDFNNLLMAMMGYVDLMLLELEETAPLRRFAIGIQETVERSAALTRQLLAFSRSQRLEPRIVAVDDAVTGLQSMFSRLIGEHIHFEFKLNGEGASIRVDPGQFSQVITNLVINARDAMPEGGDLTIETTKIEVDDVFVGGHPGLTAGAYAMVAVSDTGIGMDEATRERIFEPFFTTKLEGTGLGLSTSYGIINQSGGQILVYSELGRGTTFKIYLPLADPDARSIEPQALGHRLEGAGKTILVAEDDITLRALVRDALERVGFQVVEAANGDQALEFCAQNKGALDLVLADVVMPGTGGSAVAAFLAETSPEVPVILMSGYTTNGIVRQEVVDGGHPFLEKPFTREQLLETLARALNDREGT
jgi:two-component system cell cycle sensor histidine kinase/response regulator CckA